MHILICGGQGGELKSSRACSDLESRDHPHQGLLPLLKNSPKVNVFFLDILTKPSHHCVGPRGLVMGVLGHPV
jgi:hypothetical protein